MLSPQFKAYINETLALTKSLCIKSQQTIDIQNNYLQGIGYPLLDNPLTWKYYRNLAGLYHSSDSPMEIVSSDTREVIDLTKEVIVNHPLTAVDYGPGGIYHRELLNRYPSQKDLILRIFNPLDAASAISAADFTILYHDPRYLHEREQSLIQRLQKWLYAYADRWHIYSFAITDTLYPAAMLAVMYHAIPLTLMNLRLEACKTVEAADFHIWAYLGSRYRLDRYRQYLSNHQTMYLYRNIDYLRHNVGKEKTMLSLMANITDPVSIKASKYDATQDDSTLIADRRVQPVFLKSTYGEERFNIKIKDRYDTEHVVKLTRDSGVHDREDYDGDVWDAKGKARATVINDVPTGIVELNIKPSENEIFVNPKQVALHHWFYLSSMDKSKMVVDLNVGDFGAFSVTSRDAALLLLFAIYKLNGRKNDDIIPSVLVSTVIPLVYPTEGMLAKTLTADLVRRGYLTAAMNSLVPLPTVRTVDELQLLGENISKQYHKHYLISRAPGSSRNKSLLWGTLKSIYVDKECHLIEPHTTWEGWLETIDFPHEEYSDEEYIGLVVNILSAVVSLDTSGLNLSSVHQAMIDILKLLTSYGIVFVDGTGDKPTMIYEWPWIEPVDQSSSLRESHWLNVGFVGGKTYNGIGTAVRSDNSFLQLERIAIHHQNYDLPAISLDFINVDSTTTHYNLDVGNWDTGPVTTTVIEDI